MKTRKVLKFINKALLILVLASIPLCNVTQAAPVGYYIGVDVGYSKINSPTNNVFSPSQPAPGDDGIYVLNNTHVTGGLGNSLNVGYNFTEQFGVNVRLDKYAPSNYRLSECSMKDGQCHYYADAQLKIQEDSLKFISNYYQSLIGGVQLRVDMGITFIIQNIEYYNKTDSGNFYVQQENQIYTQGNTQNFIFSPVVGVSIERVFFRNYSFGFSYQRVFNKLHGKKNVGSMADIELIEFEIKYYFL